MNQVIPFTYDNTEVRTVIVDDEPWFVAADIAVLLGYRMASDMTRRLDYDEKGTRSVRTPGGSQDLTIISESGLYSAILRSRVEGARKFKRWVTHEVLPSIRKRGGYLTPEATEAALTDPDFIIRLATELKNERDARRQLQAQAEADAPKILFANSVATSKTSILVGELAKILKGNGVDIGQNRLFGWLRENKFLISKKGDLWNSPTQYSMELGLFEVKETTNQQPDGTVRINRTTKVTGKGQQYFINKFLNREVTAL